MTEIKAQFVQFFSSLLKATVTEVHDDSLESLHRLACKGEISALLKLGLMAQRSAHAYVEYLFADALKTINRYPFLMSYYYYRAFKTGSVSDDEKQKKGAFLATQALANFYDTGIYFPKNALFADHYRYEAACLNPEAGRAFLNKFKEKEASATEIKLLQSSLVALSLGDHEYAEKWLQTALSRPLPAVKTYFTALKNKIYIALGKRYEASSDYMTAVHYYQKIKPQNAQEFVYAFQASNIAFYTLNQPQKAIDMLAKTQPDITLPKTTENKDFFDYLQRWEKAWKEKEIAETKASKKIQPKKFEESTINPLTDIYLKTQKGEKIMAQESFQHLEYALGNISMQDFSKGIQPCKQKSAFRKKIELIIAREKKRFSNNPTLKTADALYRRRMTEIAALEKEVSAVLQPGNFYEDTKLLLVCNEIVRHTKKASGGIFSSFGRNGGNKLIEKIEEELVVLNNFSNMAHIDIILRETAQQLEADKIITKQNETIKNFESVLERKNIEIEKLSNGETVLEKKAEIDKLTQALHKKDRQNRSKKKRIQEQQKTISEQSEEIEGLNLSISKLKVDLGKSEKMIQDLNQEMSENTKAFEEKLEKQAEAHAAEMDKMKKELEENTKAFEEKLEKQAENHAAEMDKMKKELEENTKAFEEKLEKQATSHATQMEENTKAFEEKLENQATQMDKMKKEFSEQFQALNKKINEQNQTLRNACATNTKNKDKIDEYETFIKNCGGENYILEMKENYENYKKDSELFKKYTSAKNVDTPFGKDQTMETLEDYSSLTCPITQMMIKDPVVAEDGYTYERSTIEKWFSKQKISPMTNEPMGSTLVANLSLRNIISDFLNYNKSLLEKASEDNKPPLTTIVLVEKQALANNQHSFFSQSNSLPTEISVNSNFILGEEQETVGMNNSF